MKNETYFIFIVRDDRKADLLFQTSDMTWLAYNRWPQWRSFYDLGNAPWGASNGKVGYDVGFDRPYALYWNGYPAGFHPLTNGSGEFLMTEFPLAFWLEKEGYEVTYNTAPKGNLVFNAGTCWWNVVLSHPPGFQSPPRKDFRKDDLRIQRITKNILDRMLKTNTSSN